MGYILIVNKVGSSGEIYNIEYSGVTHETKEEAQKEWDKALHATMDDVSVNYIKIVER